MTPDTGDLNLVFARAFDRLPRNGGVLELRFLHTQVISAFIWRREWWPSHPQGVAELEFNGQRARGGRQGNLEPMRQLKVEARVQARALPRLVGREQDEIAIRGTTLPIAYRDRVDTPLAGRE